MDWTKQIDIYCERLGPEFWSEPVNAVSNVAFVAAGLLAAWAARQAGRLDPLFAILCMLAVAIGIGSFIFHTVAERWAALADVVPILLFIILYLAATARRFFGLSWKVAIPVTLGAFGIALLARNAVLWLAGGPLNGSEGYAPAFALIAGAGALLWARGHPAAGAVGTAAAVFLVSLTARTIDPAVCEALPVGTHFLWHLLNGIVIGVLLFAMLRHGDPAHQKRSAR